MAGQNGSDPQKNGKKSSGDLGFWITAAVFLFIGAWPVALIMLLAKLTSDKKLNKTVDKMTGRSTAQRVSARPQAAPTQQAASTQQTAPAQQTAGQSGGAQYTANTAQQPHARAEAAERQVRQAEEAAARTKPRKKLRAEDTVLHQPKKGAKVLMIVGAVLAVIGALAVFGTLAEIVSWGYYSYLLEQIFGGLGFVLCGGVMYGAGYGMRKKERRCRNYLRVIGDQRIVLLKTLASVAGVPVRRVIRDLEELQEDGRLPAGAFIDRTRECLVLDAAAMPYRQETEATLEQQNAPAALQANEAAAGMAAEGEYARILHSIRTANEDIADEAMSAKIERIESITRSIFAIVEQKPERRQEIRSFFNYYLPTTQKLLDFYAQLEEQPVQSRTIADSRKNIEGIMDNLVRGFENQLDSLFRADALDISSDISVLENMLAQDGLSTGPGEDAIAAAAHGTAVRRPAAPVQSVAGSAAAAAMPTEK